MCGISGSFKIQSIHEDDIVQMTDMIAHRGADGSGLYADHEHQLLFGHRRLAVIDVTENAKQPMREQAYGLVITYNGEIYNYQEIRIELESLGYRFKTDSDTEVILAAYHKWGTEAFNKFNGMWAFAIFDYKTRELVVSRDRFGVKPLYFMKKDHGLLFSSELKSFFPLAKKIDLNFDFKAAVTALDTFSNLEASNRTLFHGIEILPPGSYIRTDGRKFETKRWWHGLDDIQPFTGSYEKACDEFRELFFDAIRLRLRSDVPVATSLSGGIDSSAIVCSISELRKKGVIPSSNDYTAFIHSYKNTSADEDRYAQAVLDKTKANAVWIPYEKKRYSSDYIDNLIMSFEGIHADLTDGSLEVYRAQKKNAYSVTLDGHGSDEIFAGYNEHLKLSDNRFDLKEDLKRAALHSRFTMLKKAVNPFIGGFKAGYLATAPYRFTPVKPPKWMDRLGKSLFIDFHQLVLPKLLRNFDITSMAQTIEVRMPFMDYRIALLGFSLPSNFKIRDGVTKSIVRDSMRGILPDEIINRRDKIGFHTPTYSLLREELKDWAYQVIETGSDLQRTLIRPNEYRALFDKKIIHGERDRKTVQSVWKTVTLLRWYQLLNEKYGIGLR